MKQRKRSKTRGKKKKSKISSQSKKLNNNNHNSQSKKFPAQMHARLKKNETRELIRDGSKFSGRVELETRTQL